MIHFLASEPHYAAWCDPISDALVKRGVEVECYDDTANLPDDGTPTVIAGVSDQALVPKSRPLALVDHGIGQSYAGCDHQSYNGGRNRERVSLFLYATHGAAAVNYARWPHARHEVVGPARLDRWHDFGRLQRNKSKPIVAFAWHWDLTITQETRSAFAHYLPVLERLAYAGQYALLGHGHPRAWGSIEGHYRELGIEVAKDGDEVMARADLVCFDNSSFGYECAAVGIPVLALDAPFYRDQPRQPPRFYDDVPGLRLRAYRAQAPECGMVHAQWGRDNLAGAIDEALDDRASLATWRQRVVGRVYGDTLDGGASARAAAAIMAWAQ